MGEAEGLRLLRVGGMEGAGEGRIKKMQEGGREGGKEDEGKERNVNCCYYSSVCCCLLEYFSTLIYSLLISVSYCDNNATQQTTLKFSG